MDLRTAQHYAARIVQWLAPFCERIQIAGSVRRARPVCNDIDLVVIPKFSAPATDLFGNTAGSRTNQLHAMLVNYVQDNTPDNPGPDHVPRWKTGEANPEGSNFIILLPKCQLDIFIATPDNWGSKLVQRTGSKEHNVWLATRARDLGYRWELDSGLTYPNRPTIGATEDEIYTTLSLQFIPPVDREGGRLDQFILKPMTIEQNL